MVLSATPPTCTTGAPTSLANVILSAPLAQAHATGAATPVANPRPFISDSVAATLRGLLTQASTAAGLGNTAGAIDYLQQFNNAVLTQVKPVDDEGRPSGPPCRPPRTR